MNINDIITEIQYLQLFKNLYLLANIKNYTNYLLKFINQLNKNTVVAWNLLGYLYWVYHPFSPISSSWRNLDHSQCHSPARHCHKPQRHQIPFHKFPSCNLNPLLNQIKKKIIHKIKIIQFCKNVHKITTEKKDIWKLTYWIKKRNHLSSESLIISLLYEQMSSAE